MSKKLITIEVEGEHIAWSNELNEMKDELKSYENILGEVSSPTNKKKVEHFQNQFLIQKNAIDKLKNEIQKHDLAIERSGDKPFDSLDSKAAEFHKNISDKIDTELKIFKELKKEFNEFIGAQ